VLYTSKIVDTGVTPGFVVHAEDDECAGEDERTPVVHATASAAWLEVLRVINDRRAMGLKRKKPSVSGPEMFGFSDPLMKLLITELPNFDCCIKYRGPRSTGGLPERRPELVAAHITAMKVNGDEVLAKLTSDDDAAMEDGELQTKVNECNEPVLDPVPKMMPVAQMPVVKTERAATAPAVVPRPPMLLAGAPIRGAPTLPGVLSSALELTRMMQMRNFLPSPKASPPPPPARDPPP
jgi:hypothetical protein